MFHLYCTLPTDLPESRVYIVWQQKRQDEWECAAQHNVNFSAFGSSFPFPDMVYSLSHLVSNLSMVSVLAVSLHSIQEVKVKSETEDPDQRKENRYHKYPSE